MRIQVVGLCALVAVSCSISEKDSDTTQSPPLNIDEYPDTERVDDVQDYHGVNVNDPYSWLEAENDSNVAVWVQKQQDLSENYLSQISCRQALKEKFTSLSQIESYNTPFIKGDWTYYYHNDGSQQHHVVYRFKNKEDEPEVFLDPNTLSDDGSVSLAGMAFNESNSKLIFTTSKFGSDWRELHLMDVDSKEIDPSFSIDRIKFSQIFWFKNGIFFSQYDQMPSGGKYTGKNVGQKVYYFNFDEGKSHLVYENPEHPEWHYSVSTFEEENIAVMTASQSTSGNQLHVAKLNDFDPQKPSVEFTPVVSDFNYNYRVFEAISGQLYLKTNDGAPNSKIVLLDIEKPAKENWKDVIPTSDNTIKSASIVNNELVVGYIENVQTKLYRYDLDGALIEELKLPGIGICHGVSGEKEKDRLFLSFANYTRPKTVYQYSFAGDSLSQYFPSTVDFASDEYITKQVMYASKDGTKIPMHLTHKKGLVPDSTTPCFLYGYGGFNIPILPSFSNNRTVFLENGGIYAVANIRGGGEFGSDWHKSGTKENKQNVFDDFISAAEFLINEGYTSRDKLAIHGRSNGGLLVGAVMTQRPDLFKVALPMVGVLDMLKFHKFTIGRFWTVDYGCADSASNFDYLYKYSPLHNVKEGVHYPATMVLTGDHDDRVVPAHSFKFAAELQSKHQGDNPILLRVDIGTGHGAGKSVQSKINEAADLWAFVFHHLEMKISFIDDAPIL